MTTVYLDNNSTTRPLDEVVEAMRPFLAEHYANPSSMHPFGQAVRHEIESARRSIASLIEADSREIVFTSGGTESIHLAICGTLAAHPAKRHVVITAVEHSAVRDLAGRLREVGYSVDGVGVEPDGRLRMDQLAERVREDTALVSVMAVNNETGVILDIVDAARIVKAKGVPMHIDAIQAAGKMPVDANAWDVDLISLSGHKFHGPKGVGALFVRRGHRLKPLQGGGFQEGGLRPGTENVAGIVGFGVAAALAMKNLQEVFEDSCEKTTGNRRPSHDSVTEMRDQFERAIRERFPRAVIHGDTAPRIGNTSNIGFPNVSAEKLLIMLGERGIYASAGAACSSGSMEPSPVLLAMGVAPELARSSVRFSFSRFNKHRDVESAVGGVQDCINRLNH